eukprot:1155313-Pelagomonas_calceolata.AAC.1
MDSSEVDQKPQTKNWPLWPPKQNSSWKEGDTQKAQPRQKGGRQVGSALKGNQSRSAAEDV